MVVEVTTSQPDRPHAFYGLLSSADQEGGYEGDIEDEEEDEFLGHSSSSKISLNTSISASSCSLLMAGFTTLK